MTNSPPPPGVRAGNRLLAALSPEALERLKPETFEPRLGEVVVEGHRVPSHVLFPHGGAMVSLIRTDEDGGTVEVGIVGGEGALPLHSALASLPTRSEGMVQVPGPMTRIRAEAVREAFAGEEAFRQTVLVYTSVYLDQVSQNAICNRLHTLEGRLAKWLLASRQFTGRNELTLTHDFLSHMLGVRRPGVTIAIQALTSDGLINHARGLVQIVDVEGLELRACDCQVVFREGWERLMSEARD